MSQETFNERYMTLFRLIKKKHLLLPSFRKTQIYDWKAASLFIYSQRRDIHMN